MEALEVKELRVRRRILAVLDRVSPGDVTWRDCRVENRSRENGSFGEGNLGDLVNPGHQVAGGLFGEMQVWREPLFEVFREVFESEFVGPEEFSELVAEWMLVQPRIRDEVRIELFAMTLAWAEWTFAWSHRDFPAGPTGPGRA